MAVRTLTLHQACDADAVEVAALYAPYVKTTDVTFEDDPPGPAAMAERIADKLARGLPWIVARDADGALLGYAYAAPFHARMAYRFTVEPTVYVVQDSHGRGVGAALYDRLIGICTELGYRQAVALITLPNPASVALHARCAFRQSGTIEKVGYKFGRWIDVGFFQRALAPDMGAAVPEPLPLEASASWRDLERKT